MYELAAQSTIPICWSLSGLRLLRLVPTASLFATNYWVKKSARLHNNCKYSGVGSDCGRGDLYNVIFNSLDIRHAFVSTFVIRKCPTPFSLLSQSRPSHYPRSEDYGRIDFLLPHSFSHFTAHDVRKGPTPFMPRYAGLSLLMELVSNLRRRKGWSSSRLIDNSLSELISNFG